MDWFLFRSGPASAPLNMALDEALLESMPRLCRPVLRFYEWSEPAATFGYFQKFCQVERITSLRPLVRRPTGGGIVPHDSDWTYSLVLPADHEWHQARADQSYRRVHEWVCAAFCLLGVTTELATTKHQTGHGQCFAGWEKFDLLWHGKAKVAGAAQRRTRGGLLIQGSVQPPVKTLAREGWETAMLKVGTERLGISWIAFSPDALLIKRAHELAVAKYSRADYNQRR